MKKRILSLALTMALLLLAIPVAVADDVITVVYPSSAAVYAEYERWNSVPADQRDTPKNMNVPFRVMWLIYTDAVYNGTKYTMSESHKQGIFDTMKAFEERVKRLTSNNVDIINEYTFVDRQINFNDDAAKYGSSSSAVWLSPALAKPELDSLAPAGKYNHVFTTSPIDRPSILGVGGAATRASAYNGQGYAYHSGFHYGDGSQALHEFLHTLEYQRNSDTLPGIEMPFIHAYTVGYSSSERPESYPGYEGYFVGGEFYNEILEESPHWSWSFHDKVLQADIKYVDPETKEMKYVGIYPSMWQYIVDLHTYQAAGSNMINLIIPSGITSIPNQAFVNDTNIISIAIPDSVTSIGRYAFWNCSSLSNIIIPDGVTSIEAGTFNGCTSLTSITIPNSVTSIEYLAFVGCTSLTDIVIPNSVTSIDHDAFGSCTSLTSITIPSSVISIGDRAFIHCTSLTSVAIPDSVAFIGSAAFSNCPDLTIIGTHDSYTETYAKENSIPFRTGTASLAHFTRAQTYDNRFTDMNWSSDWVSKAYEYGIIAGTSATTYGTMGNMLIQDALVVASKIHSIYYTGSDSAATAGASYPTSFINYAVDNNITDKRFEGRYNQAATRAELAYIWGSILPETELKRINTYESVTDVDESHEHYEAIKLFYEAGIVTGNPDKTFKPNDPINRGECAVMFVRLVSEKDRNGM